MKKTNYARFILSIVLLILLILELNAKAFSINSHEIIGILISIILIVHLILNCITIKEDKKLKNKASAKTKISFIIGILLFINFAAIAILGMLSSQNLFGSLSFANKLTLQSYHNKAAMLLLTLLGIHIGLNFNNIIENFKGLFKIKNDKKIPVYVSTSIAILIFAFGIYSILASNYFKNIAAVNNTRNIKQGWTNRQGSFGSQVNGNNNANNDTNQNANSGSNTDNNTDQNANSENGNNSDNSNNNQNGKTSNRTGKRQGRNGNMQGNGGMSRNKNMQGNGSMSRNFNGNSSNSNQFKNRMNISNRTSQINTIYMLGIIGLFGVIAYYIEKLLSSKKKAVTVTDIKDEIDNSDETDKE